MNIQKATVNLQTPFIYRRFNMAYNPNDPYGIANWYTGEFANLTGQNWVSAVEKTTLWKAVNASPPPAPAPAPAPPSGATTTPAPAPAPPPPPPPAPIYPKFSAMKTVDKNVKVAPSDIIQWDDSNTSIALMQDLLFEDIGAVELANISRTDLIDGQQTIYSPIKNLSTVRREFNPNNIILTSYNNDYFTRFGIDIFSKTIYDPYFDDNGDLVIEIDGLVSGEEIEVEILSNGTIDLVEEL